MRNDENKDAFVNRHGHKATITSTELEELSIDNEPVDEYEPKRPVKKAAGPRFSFAWSKRRVLIIVGIVLAILLLPVIGGEVIAARYRAGASSVSGKLDDLIKTDVLPAQKQTTIKASTIATITGKIDNLQASICDGALVDNIAALYPRAKAAHDDCVAKAGQLSSLSTALKRLESEARYIESIAAATKTVTAPIAEPFAVISAQQENWQAARDAINKLRPPVEWQAVHKKLGEQTGAVADNWSKLNAAQNAQDKAGFEAAEKSLTESYEAVRTTIVSLQGELKLTQASLTAAQKALRS